MPAAAVGISLWLTPEGAVRERLATFIRELALLHGTPLFEPHLTLLGGLELPEPVVLSSARELAAQLQPFPVLGTTLDGTDEYFRCLFVRVEPTAALLAAHARAREIFQAPEQSFRPHLSLLYGELSPEEKRELLRRDAAWSFEARWLDLVRTEGPPAAWRRLAAYALGG